MNNKTKKLFKKITLIIWIINLILFILTTSLFLVYLFDAEYYKKNIYIVNLIIFILLIVANVCSLILISIEPILNIKETKKQLIKHNSKKK